MEEKAELFGDEFFALGAEEKAARRRAHAERLKRRQWEGARRQMEQDVGHGVSFAGHAVVYSETSEKMREVGYSYDTDRHTGRYKFDMRAWDGTSEPPAERGTSFVDYFFSSEKEKERKNV
jgi:hypothetical protein